MVNRELIAGYAEKYDSFYMYDEAVIGGASAGCSGASPAFTFFIQ